MPSGNGFVIMELNILATVVLQLSLMYRTPFLWGFGSGNIVKQLNQMVNEDSETNIN